MATGKADSTKTLYFTTFLNATYLHNNLRGLLSMVSDGTVEYITWN
jgi:hypothetical protein